MTNTRNPNDITRNTRNSKKGLGIGLAAGLLGGTAAGLVLGVPGLSSAADDGNSVAAPAAIVQQVDEAPTDGVGDAGDDAGDGVGADSGDRLRTVLQSLVDDGTIDAAQADAVTDHLMEQRGERHDHRGRRGPGKFVRSEVVTDLLGLDAATLRAELQAGSTLADVAADQGVSVDSLVDAIVAQLQERADAAVEAGRITAEDAAEKLADVEARVTAKVSGESLTDG